MSDTGVRCGNCEWWVAPVREATKYPTSYGNCHYNPPVGESGIWPFSLPTDFCSKFKRRGQKNESDI